MAFGNYSAVTPDQIGYAGFIGSALIFLAFFSALWALLDPATDYRSWAILSFELVGGLTLSHEYKFTLAPPSGRPRRASLQTEFQGVIIGAFAGALVIGLEMAVLSADYFMSAAQGLWLSLLAPVAETLLMTVAVYQFFKIYYPELSWIVVALFSDVSFMIFHFFAYGMRPDFLIIEAILALGNTVFVYFYHITRNATVPMIAHLVVNIAPNSQDVVSLVLVYLPWFLVIVVVIFIIYTFFGGRR
jgi:hypothetical protein